MTNASIEREITDTVAGKFGRYATGFDITITDTAVENAPMWKFDFSYVASIDGSTQTVSDGTEIGNTKSILERVWLSLLAVIEDSDDKDKTNVRGSLVRAGNDLGFVDPELIR